MNQDCKTCIYRFGHQCRRHAPIGNDCCGPIFVIIIEPIWCGDYERMIEKIKIIKELQ